MPKHGIKIIHSNKKVFHDFEIIETLEAGIVLTGTEIKSLRQGKTSIKESHIRIRNKEAFIINMHIANFEEGNRFNVAETRERKLLLNKREIKNFEKEVKLEGNTLVPIRLYLKNGFAKLEIGLARGKKNYDKRETLKKRDSARDVLKAFGKEMKGR